MKYLTIALLTSLVSTSAFAAPACPTINGLYKNLNDPNGMISDANITTEVSDGLFFYRVNDKQIVADAQTYNAESESDSITAYCKKGTLYIDFKNENEVAKMRIKPLSAKVLRVTLSVKNSEGTKDLAGLVTKE